MAEGIRIGGGGKKSGAYVWKKCQQHPDISISMNLPSTAAVVLTVACDTVDLSQVDLSFFNGYKGYLTVHGYECEFEFTTTGKANFKWDGVWHERNLTYDPATQTLTVDDNWAGVFTKTFTKEPTIIDYVVSDSPTAYPDGGEQDGYWYEKVVDGIDPALFGCTKYAVDTFTFTNETLCSTALNHSLGEIPKIAFLYSNPSTSNNSRMKTGAIYGRTDETTGDIFFRGTIESETSLETKSGILSQASVIFQRPYWYYLAGVEYTLITMA